MDKKDNKTVLMKGSNHEKGDCCFFFYINL